MQYLTESYGAQSGLIEDRINQCKSAVVCVTAVWIESFRFFLWS